jgi:hypothetical protein
MYYAGSHRAVSSYSNTKKQEISMPLTRFVQPNTNVLKIQSYFSYLGCG